MEFRPLRKEEIDCRIATIKQNGLSLLLYKDARVDMRMLDETVGQMNWKRSHQIIDGNLYCTVEIWDEAKGQWISKQDVGTESNTEKEKGQASDSFKRAGFNWGIGRELYTSPFIWISPENCNIEEGKNGKLFCYDRFVVDEITIEDGVITALTIINTKKFNKVVFAYPKEAEQEPMLEPEPEPLTISKAMWNTMKTICKQKGQDAKAILTSYGVKTPSQMTVLDWEDAIKKLKEMDDHEE